MIKPTNETIAIDQQPYEPPSLVLLGSVAAITLSSNRGSIDDFKGRDQRNKAII